MTSRLLLLRKIADDKLDDATRPAIVINKQPAINLPVTKIPGITSKEDIPEVKPLEVKKPDNNQKWEDHLDEIDSKQLSRAKMLAHKIELFEKLPPGPERTKGLRQYQENKKEYKELAIKVREISFNPETGTFFTPQGPNQERFENKILEKAGFYYPKYINRGELSKVYLGIYDNKSAIAKLTISENDKNTAMTLAALKESIPDQFSKHLLNIFDIKKVDYESKNYFVIITEVLVPANPHIKDLLSNLELDDMTQYYDEGIKTKKRSLENWLQSDPEVIEATVVNVLKHSVDLEIAMRGKIVAGIVSKSLFMLSTGDPKDYSKVFDITRNNIKSTLYNLDFGPNTLNNMVNALMNFISSVFKDIQMPSSTSDKTLASKSPQWAALSSMPETKSLVEALMFFKEKGFISIDLNRKNIMERPDTHDLVLADIGTLVPDKK